jgi:hypothetical protein
LEARAQLWFDLTPSHLLHDVAPACPCSCLVLQMVKENEKARSLQQELAQMGDDQRIIVFANTKRQVGEGRVDAWNCWTAFGLPAVQLCLLPPRLTFNFLAACPTCHTPRALQCDLVARQLVVVVQAGPGMLGQQLRGRTVGAQATVLVPHPGEDVLPAEQFAAHRVLGCQAVR